MSFVEEQDAKPWWHRVAAVAAAVLAFVVAKGLVGGGFAAWNNSEANMGLAFDREMRKPPFVELFGAMQEGFPSEYQAFRDRMVKEAAAGASSSEIKTASFNEMRAFNKRHATDLARASSPMLRDFRRAQIEVMSQLKSEDIELCAHFGMDGLRSTDRPSAAANDVLASAGAVGIRASADGARHPSNRNIKELSEADSVAFVNALGRQGLSDSDIQLLTEPSVLAAKSSTIQCSISSAIYKAIESLPAEQADRLTGVIVAAAGE